ncbi:MAG TPA: ribosome maturation factor RimM [Candidatus Baltobacteraceae bacterium]|nr:ribosome maturation factor RimM [Candidatus Baltobacteraceae bacterium]
MEKKTANSDSLPVGRIAGIFGVRGELKCDPSSAGRMLFSAGEPFEVKLADGSQRSVTLGTVREHKGRFLITIQGVDTANDAERFTGATLYADASRIELNEGEYLDRDLVGCVLEDVRGTNLGTVQRVEHYPSSDMLVVRGQLVPMVGAFIKSIDIASKRIVAELPEGLLE